MFLRRSTESGCDSHKSSNRLAPIAWTGADRHSQMEAVFRKDDHIVCGSSYFEVQDHRVVFGGFKEWEYFA